MLQMWSDDYESVIAEDLDDVKRILVEDLHMSAECFEPEHWSAVDPETDVPLQMEDGDKQDATPRVETRKAREWCALKGRGYFGGTE